MKKEVNKMNMKTGLIWNEDVTTEVGVRKAVMRFVEKFGRAPARVEVNRMRLDGRVMMDGVEVEGVKHIFNKNDFFVMG